MNYKEKCLTMKEMVCAMLNDKANPPKECEKAQLERWLAGHSKYKQGD